MYWSINGRLLNYLHSFAGLAANAVRGRHRDERFRQSQDQRQPAPPLPQQKVLRSPELINIVIDPFFQLQSHHLH